MTNSKLPETKSIDNDKNNKQDDKIISLLPRLPVISSVNSGWKTLQLTIQLLKLILQLRLYLLPFNCGWNKLGRWLSFSKITEKYHDRDMATQSHWYLALMFVNPSYQRQGVGSALLEPILDRAKNEKLPCYLVTFTEQAVNFYQKNGFKTIRKSQHGSGISRGFLGISSRQSAKDAPYFWNLKRDSA